MSWPRRLRTPLLAVAVPAALRLTVYLMDRTEVGLDLLFPMMMAFQFAALIAGLVVVVWFALSKWIPAWVKVLATALAVGAMAGLYFTVRVVEFDGQMSPRLRFRWEPTADEAFAAFRAEATPAEGTADLTVGPDDSPRFRGPAGDGTSPARLSGDWESTPPKVVWRHPVGGGHAGLAVAGNGVVTLEQRGGDEAVVCYDRDTGRERWAFAYPARFATSEPMGGDGPRTTPSVVDGLVYALGGAGDLLCLDGRTGEKKWAVNVLADAGATNLEWGMSGSPLVADGRVIVNPGVNPKDNKGQAVAAYDRYTGAKLWAAGREPAGYASPQRATVQGVDAALVFDAGGLGAYALADGRELFRFPWKTDMGLNSAQPVAVPPDGVVISSERTMGSARLDLAQAPKEVWRGRGLSARFASPVRRAGHLFGLTQGRLVCVDAATGKPAWADGDYGNGQILLAGDKLVITAEKGFVALVAASPAEFAELGRFAVLADRTWNMPALAGRRLYMRNHREVACVELPEMP